MHNFENLLFWQKSIVLAKDIYLICQNILSDEKFGLISQMKRSVVSIPSNIASESAFELQTQLILSKELNLLTEDSVQKIISGLIEIQKMIYSFNQNLKS